MKTMIWSTRAALCAVLALGLAGTAAKAQDERPLPSPKAMVEQVVGTKPVTIVYHSPGVKGRTVWGDLVPYGQVWRAGANARTTIEFAQDVQIDGKPLPAGRYGFFVLPQEDKWTLIFSKDADSNPFQYNQENDALRVDVTPKEAPFRERLAYVFDNMTDDSADIILYWEKLQAPIKITLGGGPPQLSAEQQPVFETIQLILAAITSEDIDQAMTHYGDDFASSQGGGKAEYAEFLKGAGEQGFLDGMESHYDAMTIDVDGDKAMVKGVEVEGAFGILTLDFEMQKRDGKWIVTYMDQY